MININQNTYEIIAKMIGHEIYELRNRSGVVEYEIRKECGAKCIDELLMIWEIGDELDTVIERWLVVGFRGGVRVATNFDVDEINIRLNN